MKQLEGDLLWGLNRATMRLNGRRFSVGAILRSATIWINEERKVIFLFSHQTMAERFESELCETALGLEVALVEALGMINGWTISVAPRGKDNVLESNGSLKATLVRAERRKPAGHGTAFDYWHPVYRAARKGAIARSSGMCQLCGLSNATETHHWAVRYPVEEDTTSDDLTALCDGCHDVATSIRKHSAQRKRRRSL